MKTTVKTICLAFFVILFACSKDDPAPEPQQQIEPTPEPDPEPEPENQPPSGFSITSEIDKNTVLLNWDAAIDPDNDTITYKVMLGDSLIATQTETTLSLTDLIFEKDYEGKIIADDGNDHTVETSFNFTTGFLWLTEYEFTNGAGTGYTYEYNAGDMLVSTRLLPDGELNHITYDSQNHPFNIGNITYSHNTNGLLTTISDGTEKGDLELLYDDKDQIIKVRIQRTNPSNNYSATVNLDFNYDDLGNLTSIDYRRTYINDNTDAPVKNYSRRQYTYDNEGNITEFLLENSTDGITYEENLREQFTYDNQKNPWYYILTRQLDINSRVFFGLRGEFDPQGLVQYSVEGYSFRMLRSEHNITNHKIFSEGDLILEYTYEYSYNESGYPISARSTTGNNETFPRWTYSNSQ